MTDPHNRESYQMKEDGRCPSSGAALPPFGLSPQAVSGLRPAATNAALILPARYSRMTPDERREARCEYARLQGGKCYYCKSDLASPPPDDVQRKAIDWKRFPPNFLRWPHHLHHSHDTGMTLGVVHARCNAVLWQYHGE